MADESCKSSTFQITKFIMKIDVYTLLPDRVKEYIAEEISEALAKNNIDNSAISWDIDCNVLDIEEDFKND